MHSLIFFSPLLAAFIGWLLTSLGIMLLFRPDQPKNIAGLHIQGLFLRHQKQILHELLRYVSVKLRAGDVLEQKILAPENLQKIMPEVEGHIDHFLKVKLKASMPMIGMMIGERTTSQLKEIFIGELEELFPVILKSYLNTVKATFDLEQFLQGHLLVTPARDMSELFSDALQPVLQRFKLFGALTGFIIGCADLLYILLLR